jgi:hypothetical protein
MYDEVILSCQALTTALADLDVQYQAWVATAGVPAARDVEDWVRKCLQARHDVLALSRQVRNDAFGGKLRNLPGVGEALLGAFDAALKLLQAVQAIVRDAEAPGSVVEGAEDLGGALRQVESDRAAFKGRWPWPDPETWQRSRQSIAAGRSRSAEDLLHELQSRIPGRNQPADSGAGGTS